MAKDCYFTNCDLRISQCLSILRQSRVPRDVVPLIPFMRTNFERMPADFFDPFTTASHAGRLRISSTRRWLPHSDANRH